MFSIFFVVDSRSDSEAKEVFYFFKIKILQHICIPFVMIQRKGKSVSQRRKKITRVRSLSERIRRDAVNKEKYWS